jgi:chromatin remodeling complex protein RSC6
MTTQIEPEYEIKINVLNESVLNESVLNENVLNESVLNEVPLSTSDTIDQFLKDLNANVKVSKALMIRMKTIKAEVSSMERQYKKFTKKKQPRAASSRPSGLKKLVNISDELAEFLGVEKGTQMARIPAVKKIYNYINQHNLKSTTNARHMLLDKDNGKLRSILNCNLTGPEKDSNDKPIEGTTCNILEREGLHIFNIQALIKHHFTNIVVEEQESVVIVEQEQEQEQVVVVDPVVVPVTTKKTKKSKKAKSK